MSEQGITAEYFSLKISTSNKSSFFNEKHFPKTILISELKEKLETLTGGSAKTMTLELFRADNNKVLFTLTDNNAPLNSYAVENGMRLHVVDRFRLKSAVARVGSARRPMTPDNYARRPHTVKSYLESNKMGKYSDDYVKKREQDCKNEEAYFESVKIGVRCRVNIPHQRYKFGTIVYKGPVKGLVGNRLGVKYDKPIGKHDGTHEGRRYFECSPMCGSFVKIKYVEVGDFLEEAEDCEEYEA